MNTTTRRHNLWILVSRAEDVDDCWVAHCLDWDVVGFGPTIHSSMEAVMVAVVEAAQEMANTGEERARAPEEYFDRMEQVTRNGTVELLTNAQEREDQVECLVTQITLMVVQTPIPPERRTVSPQAAQPIPLTWSCPVHGDSAAAHA